MAEPETVNLLHSVQLEVHILSKRWSETGEPLNGQLTHTSLESQLFGRPDNKSERLCTLPQGAKGYPYPSAGWSSKPGSKEARKQRDDENFLPSYFYGKAPECVHGLYWFVRIPLHHWRGRNRV